jgi:hypothetical protein
VEGRVRLVKNLLWKESAYGWPSTVFESTKGKQHS